MFLSTKKKKKGKKERNVSSSSLDEANTNDRDKNFNVCYNKPFYYVDLEQ